MLIIIENTLSPFFSLAAFLGIIIFHETLNDWLIRIKASYSNLPSFLQSQLDFVFVTPKVPVFEQKGISSTSDELSTSTIIAKEDEDDVVGMKLLTRDVDMVMNRLGISGNVSSTDNQNLNDRLGFNEFSTIFDENEPSFEEVREAFDVFDKNRDGFIDAGELQRVLCCLGFREGLILEECERMIRVVDVSSHGRIDFNGFVKFMEKCF